MELVILQRYRGETPVAEDEIAQRLRSEADRCYRWSDEPGGRYGVHSHPYRKILYVSEGSITFTPRGQGAMLMRPGDRIEIPSGTPHGALVGDEGIVCWEGVSRSQAAASGSDVQAQ